MADQRRRFEPETLVDVEPLGDVYERGMQYREAFQGPEAPYPFERLAPHEFLHPETDRTFTPEEYQNLAPIEVARRPGELAPTVGDDLYGRSLHGSSQFTRDEICRGYRRL